MNRPKPSRIALVVIVLALAAGGLWWFNKSEPAEGITLYGNVDVRQIALAFNANDRVAQMRANEGDAVKQGQVLAVLDTTLLKLRIVTAQARVDVQEQQLRRLQTGSRPEEISQARAGVAVAQAEANRAGQQLLRLQAIARSTDGRAVSRQEVDAAMAAHAVALAQLDSARKALELIVAGPRKEDIDQAHAQLQAANAELAVMSQQLADAQLRAPVDAIVRSRLLEPGDMASPQRPVYALAITSPKWVRAYIAEIDLGHVRPGQQAQVFTDSHPDQPIKGRVGYISSVAEFTPKSVKTPDLPTRLVYEIRINVDDPDGRLRLGMPATVHLAIGDEAGVDVKAADKKVNESAADPVSVRNTSGAAGR